MQLSTFLNTTSAFVTTVKGFLIAICFLLALNSCKSKKGNEANAAPGAGGRPQMPAQVQGFMVQSRPVAEKIEVPGTLLPAEETLIRAEVSGRVIKLNIPEGGIVKKGAILVKLFDQDLQSQLSKLEVQLKIAQKTEERQRELLGINGISQQEYDLSVLSVENLRADIQALRIAISKTEIRAPYSGQVGLRNISLGAYIAPADVITTLRQIDILKLEFSVPERYSQNIVKGQSINFRVDTGKRPHTATVLASENSVEAATRTLRIKAIVTEKDAELVPGSFAKVSLQLGQDDHALMIPSQAIIPQARNKQVIVYKNDTARFATVETGIRDSALVQITNGIKEGDTIITTGIMTIRPDTKVTLTKVSRL